MFQITEQFKTNLSHFKPRHFFASLYVFCATWPPVNTRFQCYLPFFFVAYLTTYKTSHHIFSALHRNAYFVGNKQLQTPSRRVPGTQFQNIQLHTVCRWHSNAEKKQNSMPFDVQILSCQNGDKQNLVIVFTGF